MDLIQGKFLRTDTVVFNLFSPTLEEFFQDVGQGREEAFVLPQTPMEVYDVESSVLDDVGIHGYHDRPLNNANDDINLHCLRAVGIGDNRGFDDPSTAIEKWYPSESEQRRSWLEYVAQRGYDEQNPPLPPGIVLEANNKYSNAAMKDVMQEVKGVSQRIYEQFLEPVELQFTVDIETNE
jgi:hypothetical protein